MKHVLIVEDDRFLAKAYSVAFEQKKIETELAFDGVEALQKIAANPPEVIILDIILPLKDGYEVLAELKANPATASIPVIIASNLGQAKEVQRGKDLGAFSYIVKSDTPIVEVIDQVVKAAQSVTTPTST